MAKKFEIRNSTAEFLIFMLEGKEDGIQVMYHNETIWCTQKAMSTLFDCSTDNIGLHLKNIFTSGELRKDSTTEFFSVVQIEGGRQVSRKTLFYNLDAIISVGYRVNSVRATQFRQWCTSVIRQFAIRGYVIDKKRMENGSFIGEDYFEIIIIELPKVVKAYHKTPNDEVLQWMLFLDNPEKEEVSRIMEENKDIKEAKEELDRISQDDLLRRRVLNRTLEIADKLQMKKELEEAKKEAQQARENERKDIIKNLHKLNIPIEQISKAVNLSEKEIKEILSTHSYN